MIRKARKSRVLLNEGKILDILKQLVEGLKYLHQENVLHRDIKTYNVFLTKDDVVKVSNLYLWINQSIIN